MKEDNQADEQVEVDETPNPKSNLKKKAVQFVAMQMCMACLIFPLVERHY